MKSTQLVCVIAATICISSAKKCIISADCNERMGRDVCFNQECHRDIPCNKDNDCFFWGAADVAHNFPHPKCYDFPGVQKQPGYGICMLVEKADHQFQRIRGGDVENLKQMDENVF